MRRVAVSILVIAFVGCALSLGGQRTVAAAPAGITLTPAAVNLELTAGHTETTTTIQVSNHYGVPVGLRFSFAASDRDLANKYVPSTELSVAAPDLVVPAGESMAQSITLRDTPALRPGSRLANLVVTQYGATADGIGILPALQLPVTIIKDDGAVTSLGLTTIAGPSFAIGMPSTITATIHNTGNMIAIPRGVVTITAPNGTVVGKGTLNVASAAVAPDASLQFKTPITQLGNAMLPGIYRITVTYGTGGGQASKGATSSFFFVAWWHGVLALAAGAVAWYIARNIHRLKQHFKRPPTPHRHRPHRRPVLIGRDLV